MFLVLVLITHLVTPKHSRECETFPCNSGSHSTRVSLRTNAYIDFPRRNFQKFHDIEVNSIPSPRHIHLTWSSDHDPSSELRGKIIRDQLMKKISSRRDDDDMHRRNQEKEFQSPRRKYFHATIIDRNRKTKSKSIRDRSTPKPPDPQTPKTPKTPHHLDITFHPKTAKPARRPHFYILINPWIEFIGVGTC